MPAEGSPSTIITSAHFPGSIVPVLSSIKHYQLLALFSFMSIH
jgi:hypothetical protein